MFFPIVVGLAVLGFIIGKSKSPVKIGSDTNVGREIRQLAPGPTRPKLTALQTLHRRIRLRLPINEYLVCEAAFEAYEKGDEELALAIVSAFQKRSEMKKKVSEAPVPSPPTAPPTTDAPASAEASSVPPAAPEPRSYESPIEGVDDDDWSMFANAMRIHPPEFETDRHVGAFHQRKDRLSALALQPGKDERQQYEAFVRDCLDHMRQKKLINEYVTSVIEVDGTEHVVTASGMLGLMKAAGPKNAVHWIQNPDDRRRFPHTTEIFLRCNSCF